MMKKGNRKLVDNMLERRAQWKRLYSQQYYERHFMLYDGELEALLDAARSQKILDRRVRQLEKTYQRATVQSKSCKD
jgi:hypothetical protein